MIREKNPVLLHNCFNANAGIIPGDSLPKKGNLLMTLDDGEGNVVYYRLLKRIE